jgi:hypothetical protein
LCKECIVAKPENKELVAALHEQMKASWRRAKPD